MTDQTLNGGESPPEIPAIDVPDTSDSSSPAGTITSDAASAGVGDDGEQTGLGSEPAPPSPEKAEKDWRDARIAKLTAQKKELATQLEELAKLKPASTAGGLDEAEVERRAELKAQAKAAQIAWDQRCLTTVEQGRKEFVDFNDRVGALRSVVDESDPREAAAYRTLLEAAMESGEAASVIHRLGGDPAEAQRLMGLHPLKMAIEVAKMAGQLEGKRTASPASNPLAPAVSNAPKPIQVPGRGSPVNQIDPDDNSRADKLSTREWMARREAQTAARHKSQDPRSRA